MLAEVAGPDQRVTTKMRPGHCTKKIHPGCPELTFLGTDTQLYQSQPPQLEIHLLEGYCSLETNATRPSKLHVPVHVSNFSCKQFELFQVRIVKGTKSNIFTCKLCALAIFIILFTGLLCYNSNSITCEPRKGQSPTLSRANCVILRLILVFHGNNSNLNV